MIFLEGDVCIDEREERVGMGKATVKIKREGSDQLDPV